MTRVPVQRMPVHGTGSPAATLPQGLLVEIPEGVLGMGELLRVGVAGVGGVLRVGVVGVPPHVPGTPRAHSCASVT